MINHNHKFIFVHITKCGGSSIEELFNCWQNKYTEKYYHLGDNKQHHFISEILEAYPDCNHYYKFSFARNPWSRFLSEYHYMIGLSLLPPNFSFKNFCLHEEIIAEYGWPYHDKSQHEFIFDSNGDSLIDFVGKLENAQQDFNVICDKIGIPHQKLPHKNKSKHKHYTEYYDEETKEIVAEKYAKDIEYFGYTFDE
tara:strand:+ start:14106 stop:14693 length:588 start_codon:yes stop_codon:yes gene_type:complete